MRITCSFQDSSHLQEHLGSSNTRASIGTSTSIAATAASGSSTGGAVTCASFFRVSGLSTCSDRQQLGDCRDTLRGQTHHDDLSSFTTVERVLAVTAAAVVVGDSGREGE